MSRNTLLLAILFMLLTINIAGAEAKFRINIGGGLGQTEINRDFNYVHEAYNLDNYNQTESNHSKVYSFYVEFVYPETDKLYLGGGVYYLYNGNEIIYPEPTYWDDYDNRRPSGQFNPDEPVKGRIFMPYITGSYHFQFVKLDFFTKLDIGFGYTKLLDYNHIEKRMYNGFAVGAIPSIGTSFYLYSSTYINLELGYRIIKTSRLKDKSDTLNENNERLDFSGVFFQTGLSFGL